MNIQWYPGHMAKARRLIIENLKSVDAVCEIIDSRIPVSSRNPDIDELTTGKPRLIVLNRIDQADSEMSRKWENFFKKRYSVVIKTDCKSGRGVEGLRGAVLTLLQEKKEANAAKGQTGKPLRMMVVGIPNVGKSSLINRAAKRKAAKTSDKPGITREKQWIRLGNGIELLDTPGVLWPKFEDQTVAENLAFTGAIRDEIMDTETLGTLLMFKLALLYPNNLTERYKIDADYIERVIKTYKTSIYDNTGGSDGINRESAEIGFTMLENTAKKRGFLLSGGKPDTERMAIILLDEFRGGKLGRITLEWL